MKSILFGLLITGSLFASSGKIHHEYIVMMNKLYTVDEIYKMHSHCELEAELLNEELKIYHFTFKSDYTSEEELNFLKSNKNIITSSPNRQLEQRGCKPNDPEYRKQWNSAFMGFEDLWCFNNNGVTPLGDTIVLAVCDNGFNINIPDIKPNIFINYNEIPDNGIDEDSNGYVDDYRGLNAISGEGDNHPLPSDSHGTNIASIAGAVGNNSIAISGAAQNIKMLVCSATAVDQLIKCYTYFIKMREDYITFKGKYGAYINISTLSQGLDEVYPEDQPLWCQVYDLCGKKGILNFGACSNNNYELEKHGDLPGLCPSDYLVIVTNTDRSDTRAGTGFSKISVDLGASGELVPVIQNDNKTEIKSGTSLSTPQVAAAAAYLNQFCEKYANICKTDPVQGVLLMKNFILSGGKKVPELSKETVTGTRFNAKGSYDKLTEFCFGLASKNDLQVYSEPSITGEFTYDIELSQLGPYELELFNLQGQCISLKKGFFDGNPLKKQRFDTRTLSSGLYLLTLRVGDACITRKFVTIH